MKLPFLHKNNSSNSSLSSTSSSSSWPWPSCHQNPKTISFRATFSFTNTIHENDLHFSPPPSSSIDSSPQITDSIENVIAALKSSKRLIFQRKGDSNSILEQEQEQNREQEQEQNQEKNQEQEKKQEQYQEEEGEEEEDLFMLMSMESRNPFSDFKKSMEEMVEAHALHQDWRNLEKLLFNFLKVNDKSSHGYIFAAFIDLLVNLALETKENDIELHGVLPSRAATTSVAGEASTSSCERRSVGESPLSPLSFYTSCSSYSSSSDETSSTSVPFMALSTLLEMDQEKKKKKKTSLDHSFVS